MAISHNFCTFEILCQIALYHIDEVAIIELGGVSVSHFLYLMFAIHSKHVSSSGAIESEAPIRPLPGTTLVLLFWKVQGIHPEVCITETFRAKNIGSTQIPLA